MSTVVGNGKATARANAPRPAERPAHRRERRTPCKAGIFGIGSALPDEVVTNADLEKVLDTDDAWIVRRTGIRQRYRLPPDAPVAPLAAAACAEALADAGRSGDEVDHVIITTITPDYLSPGLAPEVARLIGATGAGAVDLNAACTGFLSALDQASALVESGRASVVVVCAAEALSRVTDHEDRSTAILLGDGAAAVVVAGGDLEHGLGRFVLGSDGERADLLYVERVDPKMRMDGQAVFRHAVRRMGQATKEALEQAGLQVADLDLFVAHQANRRIIDAAAADLGIDPERVVIDVDRVANTSSASIPLALHRAESEGRLRPGMTVGLAAFGAGFVWGAGVLRWKERSYACA